MDRPSLNYITRRKEVERIERENHSLAKRLFSNHGTIRKRELDDSYAVTTKIKNRLTKVRKLEPLKGRSQTIDAIRYSNSVPENYIK